MDTHTHARTRAHTFADRIGIGQAGQLAGGGGLRAFFIFVLTSRCSTPSFASSYKSSHKKNTPHRYAGSDARDALRVLLAPSFHPSISSQGVGWGRWSNLKSCFDTLRFACAAH